MVLVMALVRHGIIMGKTNDIAGRELTFSITFKNITIKKIKKKWEKQNLFLFETEEFSESALYYTVLFLGFKNPIPLAKTTWDRVRLTC